MNQIEKEGFTITAEHVGLKAGHDGFFKANQHNIITVHFDDKSKEFDFWGSQMFPNVETDYDIERAFEVIVSDAITGFETFENFCSEFGYDEDSRKAYATWMACRKTGSELSEIYPGDLYELYELIREQ